MKKRNSIIEISYSGTENQLISEIAKSFEIINNPNSVDLSFLDDKGKEKLLISFLDELDNKIDDDDKSIKGLIINYPEINNKYNKHEHFKVNYDGFLRIGNYVGVVSIFKKICLNEFFIEKNNECNLSLKKEVLIKCKLELITRFDKRTSKCFQPYFLCRLLENQNLKINPDRLEKNKTEAFFDFLYVGIWRTKLKDLIKKGYYKSYNIFRGNDSKPRGSIDIPTHIKENAFLKNGKIAYIYKERTINNDFNKLLLITYNILKQKYLSLVNETIDKDIELREYINFLKYKIDNSDKAIDIIKKNLKPISHPYFIDFERLRKLCMKIIKREQISFFNAIDDDDVDGLICYTPLLWEKFIMKNIHFSSMEYVDGVKEQEEIPLFINENKYKHVARPDFVLYHKNNRVGILDAKFKTWWINYAVKNGNISKSFFSDFDECVRNMSIINSHFTGVVFPYSGDDNPSDILLTNKTDNEFIYTHKISIYSDNLFITLPIIVPIINGKSYAEWSKKFNLKIDDSNKVLKNILNNEVYYTS